MSKTKIAGKLFVFAAILILAASLIISSFINGQTNACKRYFTAFASGDLNSLSKVYEDISPYGSKDEFTKKSRDFFTGFEEFSELEENEIISTAVKVKSHEMISENQWKCVADVDFYSDGHSISDEYTLYLYQNSGKWYIKDPVL